MHLQRDIQVNGQSFRVIEKGEGPAVLFCHGFPDTADTWLGQLKALAPAGFRCIAIDMRGFGHSYAPKQADLYTSVHIAGDLVGLLDRLEIPKAVVVGHDWGADYAQRAAIMRPDRFSAVISLSIPFSPRGSISLWDDLRRRSLDKLYYSFNMVAPEAGLAFPPAREAIPQILHWLSSHPTPEERWDPLNPARSMLRPLHNVALDWLDPGYLQHNIESFEKTGFDTGMNYYRAVQMSFDLTAAYRDLAVQQPALYLWGADDGLCQFFHGLEPTLEEFQQLQPSLVRHVRFSNTGHWIQHEAPVALTRELRRFLEELRTQGALNG